MAPVLVQSWQSQKMRGSGHRAPEHVPQCPTCARIVLLLFVVSTALHAAHVRVPVETAQSLTASSPPGGNFCGLITEVQASLHLKSDDSQCIDVHAFVSSILR